LLAYFDPKRSLTKKQKNPPQWVDALLQNIFDAIKL